MITSYDHLLLKDAKYYIYNLDEQGEHDGYRYAMMFPWDTDIYRCSVCGNWEWVKIICNDPVFRDDAVCKVSLHLITSDANGESNEYNRHGFAHASDVWLTEQEYLTQDQVDSLY